MHLFLFLTLYMFRAYRAHHQERQIVLIQPLAAFTLCRWPYRVQVGRPRLLSSFVWDDRGKSLIPARIVPILLTSRPGAFRMRARRVTFESTAAILLIHFFGSGGRVPRC